jgi:hypothetical protein
MTPSLTFWVWVPVLGPGSGFQVPVQLLQNLEPGHAKKLTSIASTSAAGTIGG